MNIYLSGQTTPVVFQSNLYPNVYHANDLCNLSNLVYVCRNENIVSSISTWEHRTKSKVNACWWRMWDSG